MHAAAVSRPVVSVRFCSVLQSDMQSRWVKKKGKRTSGQGMAELVSERTGRNHL